MSYETNEFIKWENNSLLFGKQKSKYNTRIRKCQNSKIYWSNKIPNFYFGKINNLPFLETMNWSIRNFFLRFEILHSSLFGNWKNYNLSHCLNSMIRSKRINVYQYLKTIKIQNKSKLIPYLNDFYNHRNNPTKRKKKAR